MNYRKGEHAARQARSDAEARAAVDGLRASNPAAYDRLVLLFAQADWSLYNEGRNRWQRDYMRRKRDGA